MTERLPEKNQLILGLDASTPVAYAALFRDGKTLVALSSRSEPAGRLEPSGTGMVTGAGEQLIGLVDECCRQVGLTSAEIQGIAVNVGPGSFTGLRGSIAVAQGLSASRNLPVTGVSLLIAAALTELELGQPVAVTFPASRNETYLLWLRAENSNGERLQMSVPCKLQLVSPIDLENTISEQYKKLFCGHVGEDGGLGFAKLDIQSMLAEPTYNPAASVARAVSQIELGIVLLDSIDLKQRGVEIFWQRTIAGHGLLPAYIKGAQAKTLAERGLRAPD